MDKIRFNFECTRCKTRFVKKEAHGCANDELLGWRILPHKCKNCKKFKDSHKTGTLECPVGLRTRIGYITFGPTVYEI